MVPCAFVSRGIINTRMAGSSQRAYRVSLSRDSAVTSSYPGLLILRRRLDQLLIDVDVRRLTQPLQQRRAKIARLLLAKRIGVLRPVLRACRILFLRLGDLEQH